MSKILFVCGGTAGHINPALSIADSIAKEYGEIEIVFAGNPDGMEARLVPQKGYKFYPFKAMGIQRKLTPYNIYRNVKSVILLASSAQRAKKLLREVNPDIVVGTGGYVSGPIVLEASRLGIKTLTHEQNAFPGVTTKLLVKHVDKVLLATEKAKSYLPANREYIITGNPVRNDIGTVSRSDARIMLGIPENKFCILSFGGSLGAEKVNMAVADVMKWHSEGNKVYHIHSTGKFGTELFPKLLDEKNVDYKNNKNLDIREYIDDMPLCLSAADLVICRAGASTLSELEAAGRASILIPSPNVAENHQYHNAMVLANHDAAIVIEEKNLTGESLVEIVKKLSNDKEAIETLGKNALSLAMKDANSHIVKEIISML